MATREQDLSALRKLNRLVEERDNAIETRNRCNQSLDEIEHRIRTAWFQEERTNNHRSTLQEIEMTKFETIYKQKKKIRMIATILIIATLAVMVLTLIHKGYIVALFPLVQPLFWGLVWCCFKESILVKIALCFGVLFGLVGILLGSEGLGLVFLILIAVIIAAAWITYAVTKKRCAVKYSETGCAEMLAQAKKQDEANTTRNRINKQEAQLEKRRELQPEIDRLRQERERAQKVIAGKTYEIEQMNLLTEEDLEHIDYIIDRITSRRADSIKEALQQLDAKLDQQERERREAARRDLDRFLENERRRMEQERQERDLENWRDEQRRREDREFERREEHRKNVEEELREIRKKLDD